MNFTSAFDHRKQETIYMVTVSYSETAKAKIYPHDRLLFDECEKSEKISDKLLALETIARRIEETESHA